MAKPSIKRFLPLLAGAGIVAASASTVVSCTAPQYAAGIDGQRVVVVTDGGHVNDNSFNEDAYIGVKNFVANAYTEMTPVKDKDGNVTGYKPTDKRLDGSNDYVESGGTDTTSVISGYRLAVVKKANAIVLPGFAHVNSLPSALPFLHKNNVNVVLVDGVVKDPNVVSLQFNSQISGVMAGFDTSYLMGTNVKEYDTNGDGVIKIGTFAGASNKYGVDNYMWGLLLGMQIYNDIADRVGGAQVQTANNDSGVIKDIQTISNSDPNFYTNSFALGDATKTGIISKLVDKHGADVVFPVAGPQIQDVLTFKRESGRSPYVIGVDVDQAAAYADVNPGDDNYGRFITSAIKNIDTAVPEALYRASHDDGTGNTLKDFGTVNKNDPKHNYGDFNTDSHWLGKQPEPFVNWSIDFTNSTAPLGGHYLLKQNYISLYDPSDVMENATGAMKEINDHFAALGTQSVDYMKGNDIYSFAQELIDKYGVDIDSSNTLNWFDGAIVNSAKFDGKNGITVNGEKLTKLDLSKVTISSIKPANVEGVTLAKDSSNDSQAILKISYPDGMTTLAPDTYTIKFADGHAVSFAVAKSDTPKAGDVHE